MADMDDKTDPFSINPNTVMLNFLSQQFGPNSSLMLLQNGNEMHFPASENQHTSNDVNKSFNFSRKEKSLSAEEKSSSRKSLSQRIAKAGLSAPTINTAQINSANIASTKDNLSPFLTISPGLTPSAFLESPVLLSNSLAQLSPTTGKFSLPRSGGNSRPTSTSDSMSTVVEKCKEERLEEIMPDRFSFQPPLDTAPSYYPSLEFKISSPIENTVENVQNDNKEPSYTKGLATDINENPSPLEAEITGEEDGYNWRKYGQKQVKGSEYPRSYYKCTHPTCPVKKKVERSHEGHITEIVYNREHNHEMPVKKCRAGIPHCQQYYNKIDAGIIYGESILVGDHSDSTQNQDVVNMFSSTSIDDLEDGETHASKGNEGDGEGDDNESKRRNLDACAVEMNIGSRGAREPRVVVQTISEVDILDDGYRWRKYGQKVVKGNPNPRSYYKCTSAGCTVRKHIERASNDLKSVITTYEGKHNHEVPAAKNSINQSTAYHPQTQNRRHPDPLMSFSSPPFINSFNLPGFNYGVRPLDLSNIGIGGMGQMSQFKVPVLESNYYSAASVGTDRALLPKEEMGTDAYERLMSRRHPPGHQM